jgi:hypothetical protein
MVYVLPGGSRIRLVTHRNGSATSIQDVVT